MIKNFFNLLLILNAINMYSQDALPVRESLQETKTFSTNSGVWIPGKALNNQIEGSVYLFPNWNGMFKIITHNNISNQIFNLNYNIKSKTIEAFVSKDSVFQFDNKNIDYVICSDKKYKLFDESTKKGLFLEIFKGKNTQLYKEFFISLQESAFNPITQQKMEEDRYIQSFKYHLFINGKFEEIKLGKSSVLKYLADKKDKIKEYVDKNNLSYNKEEDLNMILNFYELN